MVKGMANIDNQLTSYETYIQEKQVELLFLKRIKNQITTKYFNTFVDEFSRKVFIFFSSKCEHFENFKKIKAYST